MSDTPRAHITREDVAYVAALARLTIDDDELATFTEQLESILEHVEDVEALDLAGVAPTSHPYPLQNVVRVDEVRACLDRAEVLSQAPSCEDGMFRVPPVIGEAP